MRRAVVLGLAASALAVGCGGGWEGAALSSVQVQNDLVVLITGCYDAAEGDASLVEGQIVVTTLRGRGQKDNHDCGNAIALGLTAGPDVVQPANEKRFALIGEDYRQIDYCGLQRRRCVPFSSDPLPPDCTESSLRFATIGTFGGVYPIEVLGCEGKWAMVAIDTCGGFLGDDAPACDDGPEKLLFGNNGNHWYETGFDRDLLCPDRVVDYGEDLPAWVCEV